MFSIAEVIHQQYPSLINKPYLAKPLIYLLRQLVHETDIKEFVEKYPHIDGIDFVEHVLDYFNVTYSIRDNEKQNIPSTGKVVIIANHPIGSLDGLVLLKLVHEVRTDVKVIANQMLMSIKTLNNLLLPVDNMGGKTPRENMVNIHAHLQNEGVLLMFPAGEVSRLRPQGIRDTKWKSGFYRIAKQHNAPILPIFIDAKNSPFFYSMSMIYKPLSTALLVKEMFKQRKADFPIRIGNVIPHQSYQSKNLPLQQTVKLFMKHIYAISGNKRLVFDIQNPIALPENRSVLQQELKQRCEILGETGDNKCIYLYKHKESSAIMREIGRLREVAFRAVGEGTLGKRDIDRYDSSYYHLLIWDHEDLEIVGAYRFGNATKLVTKERNNLYSASLFEYKESMTPYFAQGLELGRSFVQPRYWGKRSLDHLWYGIGAFVRKYPHYRYLFGPVSLSDTYPEKAKQAIIHFYQRYFGSNEPYATAKNPYILKESDAIVLNGEDYKADLADLKNYLQSMELNIPALFKQYTELTNTGGTSFHAFNIDPAFNNCIDGLIIVDLKQLKKKKYERYISKK